MKLFIDTANTVEIEECLKRGIVQGITTNPSILAKEPRTDVISLYRNIAELCDKHCCGIPLSVEVTADNLPEMMEQAMNIKKEIPYVGLNIKIPLGTKDVAIKHAWEKLDA